ncbi:MAG: hypothetical protein KC933_05705 [Myxococcales bacterium]|nr:hypothetical protein [Myxococcales bacterium]
MSLPGSASSFGQLDREARIWLGLTALLHLVAVFRWPGYLHPDEHFQTLELASYALGHTPADALPWEFEARIRPWFQPGLYALVGLVVPPDRPFAFATACRGLSALIAWLSVLALGTRYRAWFPDAATRRFAWAATATFYVLPVLRVRTSSENLGAALFVLGLALAVSPRDRARTDVFAGLLAGLGFLARYQMGFMVVGLLAWRLIATRAPRRAAVLSLGVLTAIGLGVLVDRWGYGIWQLTPWRYAVVNLLEGKAASFGEAPPWAYAGYLWHDLALPFDLLTLLALPLALLRAPRHPLVWVNLPFVLGHAVIGHKEPRFLYPYLCLVPPLLAVAGAGLGARVPRGLRRVAVGALVVLDAWWLLAYYPPELRAGPWLEPLVAVARPISYGGEDPFRPVGPRTRLYAGERVSTARPATDAAASSVPLVYYHYQRRARSSPVELEEACDRLGVWPWPWAVLPDGLTTSTFGRHALDTEVRHAVYLCPGGRSDARAGPRSRPP